MHRPEAPKRLAAALTAPLRRFASRLSLRSMFTLPSVMLIVVTVGLTGLLALRNGQAAVNDLAGRLQRQVTASIQQRLDTYLQTPHLINRINLDAIQLRHVDPHNAAIVSSLADIPKNLPRAAAAR